MFVAIDCCMSRHQCSVCLNLYDHGQESLWKLPCNIQARIFNYNRVKLHELMNNLLLSPYSIDTPITLLYYGTFTHTLLWWVEKCYWKASRKVKLKLFSNMLLPLTHVNKKLTRDLHKHSSQVLKIVKEIADNTWLHLPFKLFAFSFSCGMNK